MRIQNIGPAKAQAVVPRTNFYRRLLGKRDWIIGALLVAATAAAYHPAWNGKPVWDDAGHITRPELRSLHGLVRIWTEPGAAQQYYPLVHTAFWIQYRLWGEVTTGYHLVTLLMHCIAALLLVAIIRRLAIPGAWLAGIIFALHPIQAESVAWISELKNTLSAVFFFGAVLVYLKFDVERKRNLYAMAFVLFILGLLSKSAIAPFPVAMLAILWWQRGRLSLKRDMAPLAPFLIAGILSGVFTAWMEHTFIINSESERYDFSPLERSLIAGRAVWFYLGKIAWPRPLIFFYPRWTISLQVWRQYCYPAAVLALAVVLWAFRKKSRGPMAAFLYFSAMLFPALGFINIYPFQFSFVADHFQYLAGIGPMVLAASWMSSATKVVPGIRRFLYPSFCCIFAAGLAILTWQQSSLYADAATLYQRTVEKNPSCWLFQNNLGNEYLNRGQLDEAILRYRKALAINPAFAAAYVNIGSALLQKGLADNAVAEYRKALEIDSRGFGAPAQAGLGMALVQAGKVEEGIACYRKALQTDTAYTVASINLADALVRTGRLDQGIAEYRKALAIDSFSVAARVNLGTALMQSGKSDEGIAQFRLALAIDHACINASIDLGEALPELGRTGDARNVVAQAMRSARSEGRGEDAAELTKCLEKIRLDTNPTNSRNTVQ